MAETLVYLCIYEKYRGLELRLLLRNPVKINPCGLTNSVVTREEVTLIPYFLISLHLVTFLMFFSLVQLVFTQNQNL